MIHIKLDGWQAHGDFEFKITDKPEDAVYVFTAPSGKNFSIPRLLVELAAAEQNRQMIIEQVKEATPVQLLNYRFN